MTKSSESIFDGLKILEFGRFVAGPYAAELFAHGGADVIKVEPTDGDATRFNAPIFPGEGKQYIIKARGKRGLPVDLAHPDGRAIVKKIAADCDVIVSNMRPGALIRYELDYESLKSINPRVIVGEISAFGDKGPYGGLAGADFQAQAASGLVLSAGAFDGDSPQFVDAFLTDYMAGTLLAFAISSALWRREKTGLGQEVSTTLFQAGLALQHGNANIFEAVDSWKREFVDWIEEEQPDPRVAAQKRRALSGTTVVGGLYKTLDERYIALGSSRAGLKKLLPALDLDDPFISDPNWMMPDNPAPHFDLLKARIRVEISNRTSSELGKTLSTNGIAFSILEYLEEAMLGAQANESGFVYTADHPAVGPMIMPQAPVTFGRDAYSASNSSPRFGEHTRKILDELGFSDSEITDLINSGVVAETLSDSAQGS